MRIGLEWLRSFNLRWRIAWCLHCPGNYATCGFMKPFEKTEALASFHQPLCCKCKNIKTLVLITSAMSTVLNPVILMTYWTKTFLYAVIIWDYALILVTSCCWKKNMSAFQDPRKRHLFNTSWLCTFEVIQWVWRKMWKKLCNPQKTLVCDLLLIWNISLHLQLEWFYQTARVQQSWTAHYI